MRISLPHDLTGTRVDSDTGRIRISFKEFQVLDSASASKAFVSTCKAGTLSDIAEPHQQPADRLKPKSAPEFFSSVGSFC